MPKLKISDLNELYREAEDADKELFAEQRSNILLVAGEHYSKSRGSFERSVRTSQDLTENQKLRLTKNHMHRIQRRYVSSILSHAPGVTIDPANEKELQDQKAAQLNKSVWEDAKRKHRFKEKVREFVGDFVTVGECVAKIFWDPNAGHFKGYSQALHEETGEPLVDDAGQPVADPGKPVFSGDFVIERVFAYNLLRSSAAVSMRDPGKPWILRKMVATSELKLKYADDSEKLKAIGEGQGEEFVVFDTHKAAYSRQKKQTLVKEFYFPVSLEYPEGYFVFSTEKGILEEGTLPFGVFPLIWAGCDEYQSSPRRRSPLKVARPYQAEINRAASQMAMAQITIGDDKVLYQSGTKLSQGSLLPGVRGIAYQGAPPTILAGRDGSQFLPYLQAQVQEMDYAMMLESVEAEKDLQLDPYTLLMRSMKQQLKFSLYGETFGQFLIDLCTTYLELAREYLDEEALIPMLGMREFVNISEFKTSDPLCYRITVEEQDETVDSKLGKQLALNHALQYVGGQLSKEDIGRVMRAMPFGNFEEAFGKFLVNEDNLKNDLLRLDRGQVPPIYETDDNNYVLEGLANRMKQADFEFQPDQVKQAYDGFKAQHEQALAMKTEKILAAKQEAIPTAGAMIACDMYVPDKADPNKVPKRVRIPYDALNWLVTTLEAQGQSLGKLETMNQGMLAQMADMLLAQHGGGEGQGMSGPSAPQGMAIPQGVH
jgi:hypothetical protein